MDIVLQLCQNLVEQRLHTGSLSSPVIVPPLVHKPPHRTRETLSPATLLRRSTESYLGRTRSYEDLTQPKTISPNPRSSHPPHGNSSSCKRGKQSVSFSCETVLQQCHETPTRGVMEAQAGVEGNTKGRYQVSFEEPEGGSEVTKESAQRTLRRSIVTAAAAVLHRHKNTRKNT